MAEVILGDSFSDLSRQAAGRQELASRNYFATLAANQRAFENAQSMKQQQLGNQLGLVSAIQRDRLARQRMAADAQLARGQMGLDLFKVAEQNRRADDLERGRFARAGIRADVDQGKEQREGVQRRNASLLDVGLKLVSSGEMTEDHIESLTLPEEDKAILRNRLSQKAELEDFFNTEAKSIADSANLNLSKVKAVTNRLKQIYADETLDKRKDKYKAIPEAVSKVIAESEVPVLGEGERLPSDKPEIISLIAQMERRARENNQARVGDKAIFDEPSGRFVPRIPPSATARKKTAPANQPAAAPATQSDPLLEQKRAMLRGLIQQGIPLEQAAQIVATNGLSRARQ